MTPTSIARTTSTWPERTSAVGAVNDARRMSERMMVTVTGQGTRTVVLANGFCTSARSWSNILPQLAGDLRVVQFEYIGNPGTPQAAWNADRYQQLYGHADDVVLLLQELGVRHATFVGHSMSAMIGALVHIAAPATVGHIIMMGATPRYLDDAGYVGGFELSTVEEIISNAERDLEQWITGYTPEILGPDATDEHVREYIAHFVAMRPDAARQMLASVFRSDFRHALPKVRCPVDVLRTREDNVVPAGVSEYLVHHMPQARLHLLPVSGHVPHLTHSDIVAPLLRRLVLEG